MHVFDNNGNFNWRSVIALMRNAEKFITYAEAINEIAEGNTVQIVTG
jgi:hypothetical protein